MKRHCSVCGTTHHDKRYHAKKAKRIRRRNLDAFVDAGGVIHPIRGSKGYDSADAGDSSVTQAKQHWRSGRAYIDNRGNYHLRAKGEKSGHGPVAPWNKAAKKVFKSSLALHNAAMHKGRLI